jgi:hypothetical protein
MIDQECWPWNCAMRSTTYRNRDSTSSGNRQRERFARRPVRLGTGV